MSPVSSFIGQHFAYAEGRIGVLQQLLLTQSDVDRLLGASNRKDAEKILTELKMTNHIDQSLKTAEVILPAVGQWIRSEVEQMCPVSKLPIFSIIWLQGDAPLLSYLLKKKHGLTSAISREPSDAMSSYSAEELRTLIEENKAGHLPEALVSFVKEVVAMKNPSPKKIDAAVAQYVADMQRRLAKTSGSAIIKRYVSHRIDLLNIRTALRAASDEEMKEALVSGGDLDVKRVSRDPKKLASAVAASKMPYFLSESITKVSEDPVALERSMSEVIAKDIAEMWNIPLSIEPLFAFAAIAQSHMRVLRVLIIGKSNELSPQEIKKILPPFIPSSHYVL